MTCSILVMAAGVNYNGVWAALGTPISPIDGHKNPYHIAGSDASGIVWAVGSKVKRWKVGDEVVVHCNQDDGDDEECNGGDPMFSPIAAHLGLRDAGRLVRAVLPRAGPPAHGAPEASDLGRERLLHADARHRPIACCSAIGRTSCGPATTCSSGARSGGLGSFAVQLCAVSGANAIGVISDEIQARVRAVSSAPRASSTARTSSAGARCRRSTRPNTTRGRRKRANSARRSGTSPARATMSTSCSSIRARRPSRSPCLVVKRGGMVVFCAGTTGYNLTFDARYVWMRQKRIQGSHFANLHAGEPGQPAGHRAAHRSVHVGSVPLGATSRKAHMQDVEERASARQHGGAGFSANDRSARRSKT